jgi:hypothetical protein
MAFFFRNNMVVTKIDSILVRKLLEILRDAARHPSTPLQEETQQGQVASTDDEKLSPEAEVVRHTIGLLVFSFARHQELLDEIYAFDGLQQGILFGVLATEEETVRIEVSQGILEMCTKIVSQKDASDASQRSPLQFFLSLLLPALPNVYEHEDRCPQYFSLLRTLLQQVTQESQNKPNTNVATFITDIDSTAQQLCSMIKAHPTLEMTDEDSDEVLQGLLGTMADLLQAVCGPFCGNCKLISVDFYRPKLTAWISVHRGRLQSASKSKAALLKMFFMIAFSRYQHPIRESSV